VLRKGTVKFSLHRAPLDTLLDPKEDDVKAHLLDHSMEPRMVSDDGFVLDFGEVLLRMVSD
jgi:hypothetical protein